MIYSFRSWEYEPVFIFVAALKYNCTLNDRNLVCLCRKWFCGLSFFILVYSSCKMLNTLVWPIDNISTYCHYLSVIHLKWRLNKCSLIVSWDTHTHTHKPEGILGLPYSFWSSDNSVTHSTIFYWSPWGRLCTKV